MKAFVAVVAALAASAKAQVLVGAPYGGFAGYHPYAAGYHPLAAGAVTYAAPAAAPVVAAAAPAVIAAAPAAPLAQQFHTQDEFGNVAHGYSNINSAKHEAGNTYGGVSGSYSYVDANGVLQTTNYIADGLGFRVQATNLPVAPAVPEVAPLVAPVFEGKAPVFNPAPLVGPSPVEKTPEVLAAEAEHAAAHAIAKRSTPAATAPLAAPAPFFGGFAPFAGYAGYAGHYAGHYAPTFAGYAGHYAAPAVVAAAPAAAVVPSAPAAREAVLTKIQLNPGHAVAYRVD